MFLNVRLMKIVRAIKTSMIDLINRCDFFRKYVIFSKMSKLSHFYEIGNFQQKIDFEICRTDDSTGYSSSHQVNSIDHYDLVFEHFSRFRAGLKIFVIFEIF